jgi:hypothetical protein
MILIKGKTNLEEKISKNFPEWKKMSSWVECKSKYNTRIT